MEKLEGGKEGAAEHPHLYNLPKRACFTVTHSQNSDMLKLSFRTAPEILPPTELMNWKRATDESKRKSYVIGVRIIFPLLPPSFTKSFLSGSSFQIETVTHFFMLDDT